MGGGGSKITPLQCMLDHFQKVISGDHGYFKINPKRYVNYNGHSMFLGSAKEVTPIL